MKNLIKIGKNKSHLLTVLEFWMLKDSWKTMAVIFVSRLKCSSQWSLHNPLTRSSRPSARITTILPCRLRPVLPMRCMRRIGLFWASKHMIRSTSPISKPSSPTQVETSVLYPPSRNRLTTSNTSNSKSHGMGLPQSHRLCIHFCSSWNVEIRF